MKFKEKFENFCQSKKTLIANAILALVACLFYFSEHSMLGFIGFYTFKALPYMLGALGIASAIISLVLLFYKNNRPVLIATFVFNCFLSIIAIAYFIGLYSYSRTFLYEMAKILLIYAFFAIIVYLCFFHSKKEYKGKKVVAIVLCAVIMSGTLLGFTDFSSLKLNFISNEPVVYAVGEDYQIVWTTNAKGSGWVEIGGEKYYDTYAGQIKTETKVHKVTIPQSLLDDNKGYSVCSNAIISEQGFTGLLGYTVKKSYSFRPVDTSDGIQSYVLTDTHDFNNAPVKSASYYGDNLDFLIICGDNVNFVDNEDHFSRILSLGHRITKGSRPVVYARGNHELKCELSESLDKYVGSQNQNFYYTFRLQNVWGVVLDMGEDHDDDWKEYYGTALYSNYRKEQIAFLDKIIADSKNEYESEGVEYKLGICHTNTAMTYFDSPFMYDDLVNINDRLNEIGLDVMLSGHLHELYKIEAGYEAGRPLFYNSDYKQSKTGNPDYIATGANYPTMICGRSASSFDPNERTAFSKFTGVALDFSSDGKYLRFTNQKKEVLYTVSPFENIDYGRIIEV